MYAMTFQHAVLEVKPPKRIPMKNAVIPRRLVAKGAIVRVVNISKEMDQEIAAVKQATVNAVEVANVVTKTLNKFPVPKL